MPCHAPWQQRGSFSTVLLKNSVFTQFVMLMWWHIYLLLIRLSDCWITWVATWQLLTVSVPDGYMLLTYSLYHSLDYKTLDSKKLMQNHLDFMSSTQMLIVKLLWDGSSNLFLLLELSCLLNVLSLCDSWLDCLLFDWMLAVRVHASHISRYPKIFSNGNWSGDKISFAMLFSI